MCGIIYIKRKDEHAANRMIIKQYQRQKTRGSQGFGVLCVSQNKLQSFHCETEKIMLNWLKDEKNQYKEILFHHRYPTSTPNKYQAAHPILIKNNKNLKSAYYFVHNGIINNAKILKEKHEKLGFKYQTELPDGTFNDSESLGIEFALYLEGKQTEIEAEGSAAIIAVEVNPKTNHCLNLHISRSTNPLNAESNKQFTIISSEGTGSPMKLNTLITYNYQTKLTEEKEIKLLKEHVWQQTTIGYQGYGNYHRSWKNPYDDEETSDTPADIDTTDKNDFIMIISQAAREATDAIAKNDYTKASLALFEIQNIANEVDMLAEDQQWREDRYPAYNY